MSNCRRLLCRQLSSAYLNYLPFYFLIYRPFSLYLSSCEYWQSLPSLNTYG
ncbi:BGN_3a_G0044990.mRNA.1.CDS.1 [Saccharomyces cerevisiae]|nr:BGN_3a_G0044990.mRNA.1.CDS.1 [Saccharomyces cerevisiae]CAI5321325.1 BFH_HP2_G0044560.mRNA.1.CDS.1 [Saccharomyces cerevisiae]CAI6696320.1 ASN_HP1_G0044310.mRNA.1.CDS.1 [Saccharomyces cerevisiae]CAI6728829.1 BFH_HP2_G0044560.mRNA.1.CDS.1 [Saccharomyces cerevisiae]CAI6741788.1 BFH_HP1_G0044970.mRNA.1.CDS.1 [Saccharomyces cerevisiae]